MKFFRPSIACLALVTLVAPAHGALIASADFEDNSLAALAGQGGGTGWTNNWSSAVGATVVNTTLSYSNGSVSSSGGSRAVNVITGTAITDSALARNFTSQTGTVYMSFLWRDSVNDTAPNTGNDFAQIGFDPTAGNGNPNISFLRQDSNLGARAGTSGRTDTTVDTVVGTTFMIVLKATATGSNYNVDLWVNPSNLTEAGEGASGASVAGAGINEIGTFLGRVAFGETDDAFQIDNVLIGTTWSDVVIPEPSSFLLGALGSLLLLRRRRI